jgi:ribonuclease HII
MSLASFYKNDPNVFEIGVDEAGRGPMFGRVYSAAVVLPKDPNVFDHARMKDSKRFHSKTKIAEVADYIQANAVAWAVKFEDERTIDDINILQATQRCMHSSVAEVVSKFAPDNVLVLVDGNYFNPMDGVRHVCIEGGDNKYSSIAAASILAKVWRDRYIDEMCRDHPELVERYGLQKNKGYGTKTHMEGLKKYGPSPWHRQTFGMLKKPPTF